jgi:hypothetical protein
MRARLRWWQLDQELAAGADPHQPRLRMRATMLTHPRTRESIASRLESAVAEAESRPPDRLSAAIPVRRETVREARPLMLSLALALREPGRVSPQGVARAELLVKDGGSPLYWNEGGDLLVELRSATAALDLPPRGITEVAETPPPARVVAQTNSQQPNLLIHVR